MRPGHRLLGALAGLLVGALVGGGVSCLGTSAFSCDDDAACDLRADGRCEGDGHCSYPDDTCPLGRRYADAGELGEECVGAATGTTGTSGADTTTTGDTEPTTTGDTDTDTGSGLEPCTALWTIDRPTPNEGGAAGWSVAVDDAGDVVIAGWSFAAGSGNQLWVGKYSAFAEPRWEATLGKLAETDSRAGLALWPAGDDAAKIVVAAATEAAKQRSEPTLVVLSGDGDELGRRVFDDGDDFEDAEMNPLDSFDAFADVAWIVEGGSLVVVGSESGGPYDRAIQAREFAVSGDDPAAWGESWSATYPLGINRDRGLGVAVADGFINLGGHRRHAGGGDPIDSAWLGHLRAGAGDGLIDASDEWSAEAPKGALGVRSAAVHGVAVLADGSIVTVGEHQLAEGGSRRGWLARWGADGALAWEETLAVDGYDRDALLEAVIADDAGGFVVTGKLQTGAQDQLYVFDLVARSYAADGSPRWTCTAGDGGAYVGHGLAFTAEGDVIVVGSRPAPGVEGGSRIWARKYPG